MQICAVTTTVVLNCRRSPETGDVIGLILQGAQIPVAAKTSYWYNVRFEGNVGWVSGDFAQPNDHC